MFESCVPILTVTDLECSTAFYRDALGFSVDFRWGDPVVFVGFVRDKVAVHLTVSEVSRHPAGGGNLNFIIERVDEFYDGLRAAGVSVLVELDRRDYGMADFSIADPDGNILTFGSAL